MKKWSIKKKLGVVVAAAVLASTAVFAGGIATSTIVHGHPESMRLTYAEIGKAEKELGYDIQAVKTFDNGYEFKDLDILENKDLDEQGNTVGEFKSASIAYTKENQPILFLDIEKKRNNNTRKPKETSQYNDIMLSYYLDHYKFVPANYELTEEDKVNSERDDYYISYGAESEQIEENETHIVTWEIGDIEYSMLVLDTQMSTSELFDMAQEVIDAK